MAAPKVQSSPRLQPFSPLSLVEREAACAVLEDCVDQLAVLGAIMPNYAEKPSAADRVSRHDSIIIIIIHARQMQGIVGLACMSDPTIIMCACAVRFCHECETAS